MESKQVFQQFYTRLKWEGIIKALLLAVICGFAANFLVAFITWFFPINGLWLSIGIGLGVFALTMPLFYFTIFRPSSSSIAMRVDRLGLEERNITMLELENDPSYIALRQREDARQHIQRTINVNVKVKFNISLGLLILAPLAFTGGVSMTTVTGLSAQGVIPDGEKIISNILPEPEPVEYEVSYRAFSATLNFFSLIIGQEDMGGMIEGEAEQIVTEGEDATTVYAVANEGWMFYRWDVYNEADGTWSTDEEVEDPTRTDENVQSNLTYRAIFVQLGEGSSEDEGNGSGSGSNSEGDSDKNEPSGQEGNGGAPGKSPNSADGGGGVDGATGAYNSNSQIIDGNTYYRDVYEAYYEEVMEILAAGGDIPEELRDFIEAYFDAIL